MKKKTPTREDNLAQKYHSPGQCTTIMIRNIPTEYTPDELIEEVTDNMGSADLFDFLYLPWDSPNDGNVGYAFINFHTPELAQHAIRLFSNYRFRLHDSAKKSGKVSQAHIQGLENNLRHLQDRAVVHGNHPFTPVVMWKGRKIELSTIFQALRAQDTARRVTAPASAPGIAFQATGAAGEEEHVVPRVMPPVSAPGGPRADDTVRMRALMMRSLDDSAIGQIHDLGKSRGLLLPDRRAEVQSHPPGVSENFAALLDRAANLTLKRGLHAFGPQASMRLGPGFGVHGMHEEEQLQAQSSSSNDQMDVGKLLSGDLFEEEQFAAKAAVPSWHGEPLHHVQVAPSRSAPGLAAKPQQPFALMSRPCSSSGGLTRHQPTLPATPEVPPAPSAGAFHAQVGTSSLGPCGFQEDVPPQALLQDPNALSAKGIPQSVAAPEWQQWPPSLGKAAPFSCRQDDAGGEEGVAREIHVRNAGQDALQKFLNKFGS